MTTVATLQIKALKCPSVIGVYKHERHVPQNLFVSLSCRLDITQSSKSDDLKDTLDYDALCKHIQHFCKESNYQLIESLIVALSDDLKSRFHLKDLKLSIDKPDAIADCESVTISL